MKASAILSLSMRLIALLLGIHAIVYVPMIGWSMAQLLSHEPSQWPNIASQASAFILSLVAACLLFRYADPLTAKFVSSDEEIDIRGLNDLSKSQDMFQFALKVIGAVCVAFSIPQIVGQGIMRIMLNPSFQMQLWSYIVPGYILLGVGVYLLKDGRFLMGLAYGHRIRGSSSGNTS